MAEPQPTLSAEVIDGGEHLIPGIRRERADEVLQWTGAGSLQRPEDLSLNVTSLSHRLVALTLT